MTASSRFTDPFERKAKELLCTNPTSSDRVLEYLRWCRRHIDGLPRRNSPGGTINWQLRFAPTLAKKNKSEEKILEKELIKYAMASDFRPWGNQMPACSGYFLRPDTLQSWELGKVAVDLASWEAGTLTLIELKWASNRPCEAAGEILMYFALYDFSRQHWAALNPKSSSNGPPEHLSAHAVALQVRAPRSFYQSNQKRHDLVTASVELRGHVQTALDVFSSERQYRASFNFTVLPEECTPDIATHDRSRAWKAFLASEPLRSA